MQNMQRRILDGLILSAAVHTVRAKEADYWTTLRRQEQVGTLKMEQKQSREHHKC